MSSTVLGSWADGPVSNRDGVVKVAVAGAAFTTLPLNVTQTTDAISTKGLRKLDVYCNYVFSAATSVTMTVQCSLDGVTYNDVHILQSTVFPTLNSGPAKWSYAAGASKNWIWTVGDDNAPLGVFTKLIFASVGGAAGDTLTVTAMLSR